MTTKRKKSITIIKKADAENREQVLKVATTYLRTLNHAVAFDQQTAKTILVKLGLGTKARKEVSAYIEKTSQLTKDDKRRAKKQAADRVANWRNGVDTNPFQ